MLENVAKPMAFVASDIKARTRLCALFQLVTVVEFSKMQIHTSDRSFSL
jgi:hypothetical protein